MKFLKELLNRLIRQVVQDQIANNKLYSTRTETPEMKALTDALQTELSCEEFTQVQEQIWDTFDQIHRPFLYNIGATAVNTPGWCSIYGHLLRSRLLHPQLTDGQITRITRMFFQQLKIDLAWSPQIQVKTLAVIPTNIKTQVFHLYPDMYEGFKESLRDRAVARQDYNRTVTVSELMAAADHDPSVVAYLASLVNTADVPLVPVVLDAGNIFTDMAGLKTVSTFVTVLSQCVTLVNKVAITAEKDHCHSSGPTGVVQPQCVKDGRALMNILLFEVGGSIYAREADRGNRHWLFLSQPTYYPKAIEWHTPNDSKLIPRFFYELLQRKRLSNGTWSSKLYQKVTLPTFKFDPKIFLIGQHFRTRVGTLEDISNVIKEMIEWMTTNREQNNGYRYTHGEQAFWLLLLFTCITAGTEKVYGSRHVEARTLAQHVTANDYFNITF